MKIIYQSSMMLALLWLENFKTRLVCSYPTGFITVAEAKCNAAIRFRSQGNNHPIGWTLELHFNDRINIKTTKINDFSFIIKIVRWAKGKFMMHGIMLLLQLCAYFMYRFHCITISLTYSKNKNKSKLLKKIKNICHKQNSQYLR